MHTFNDKEDREWALDLNITTLKRVRDLCGVNLAAYSGNLYRQIAEDPVLLCNIIFAMCRDRFEELGLTEDQFGAAMGGDTIDAATTALLEEIRDFCPSPARRKLLGELLEKGKAIEEKAFAELEAQIKSGALDEALTNEIEKEVAAAKAKVAATPEAAATPEVAQTPEAPTTPIPTSSEPSTGTPG